MADISASVLAPKKPYQLISNN